MPAGARLPGRGAGRCRRRLGGIGRQLQDALEVLQGFLPLAMQAGQVVEGYVVFRVELDGALEELQGGVIVILRLGVKVAKHDEDGGVFGVPAQGFDEAVHGSFGLAFVVEDLAVDLIFAGLHDDGGAAVGFGEYPDFGNLGLLAQVGRQFVDREDAGAVLQGLVVGEGVLRAAFAPVAQLVALHALLDELLEGVVGLSECGDAGGPAFA